MLPLLYSALTRPLAPMAMLYLAQRRKRGKEHPIRFRERRGIPSGTRPEGPLIWIHAASVGEATAVLGLIEYLLDTRPDLEILVTTGTVTSARLLETRLPARARHQFVPADLPSWTARFLDHWRPDLALWVESELWPNLVFAAHARNIPMVLVNARLSARSYGRWRHWPGLIGPILSAFDLCLAQDQRQAERFRSLGARQRGRRRRSQSRRSRIAVRPLRTVAPARRDRFASAVARCQHARRRGEGRRASTSRARRAPSRPADDHRSPPSGARRRNRRDAGGARAAHRPARSRRSGHSRHASLSRGHDGRARAVLPPCWDCLRRRLAGRQGRAQPVRGGPARLRRAAWPGYEQLRRDGGCAGSRGRRRNRERRCGARAIGIGAARRSAATSRARCRRCPRGGGRSRHSRCGVWSGSPPGSTRSRRYGIPRRSPRRLRA